MESVSYQRRTHIRKARQRDPIVSVFMHDNPNRCYSISVPPSKSWTEFINKIKKQFNLSSDSVIKLYQATLDDNDSDNDIDLNELHEYDINDNDMSKIKHKYVFCVEVVNQKQNKNLKNNDTKKISLNENQKQKQKKKKRKNRKKNQKKNNNDSETSNSSSSSTSDDEVIENKQNESQFGLDLDIFGRFCTSKKPPSKKNNKKPVYHYHPHTLLQSLPFHVKETWLNLKTQELKINHIDDKFTLMKDANNNFSLRTRRIIWPRNLQFVDGEFEYRLDDINNSFKWAFIIVHGGKFAGAIYHGTKCTLHKTLSRYVVRKKQGKRQINHISTSGVRTGSAGGFKRAENERKLLNEIREILSLWQDELIQCDKIFIHAPGIHNQMTIYGNNEEQNYLYPQLNGGLNENLSKERLLDTKNKNKNKYINLYRLYKKDDKIIQIPITTHKVTLREIERVHYWLSTCWLTKN